MGAVLTGCLVGLVLGMRHALEPDHLTAVCTLVAANANPRRGLVLGALWGLGHSLSLLAVGMLLALLQARLPPRLADAFELAVAAMLIALGVRAFARGVRGIDLGPVPRRQQEQLGTRSLLVGLVHGLAGSGALTTLVLAELPTTTTRIAYMALFGAGSIVGMALLSGLAGWPLMRIGRSRRAASSLAMAAGALSIAFGLVWGARLCGAWQLG
ncbi:MAG: Nickel transporter UreH [bacterium]|nr:Nickel transporter UreH [bacterium]